MAKKKPRRISGDLVPLTQRQRQILRWIVKYEKTWGVMPSTREIGEAFAISSPNGVAGHLKAIEEKGWIGTYENISRGIVVLQEPD